MINLTVKTLDSQNHQFTVDDSLTVEQFKNHIAERVNIPAARQRIIYCGRVLQDNSKLSDYDVDGKVVHLVQQAPPSNNPRPFRSITPPPDLNRVRGFRGFDRPGNAVYMGVGSMQLQNLLDPPATHTLSSSRLNVARRMLRQAEAIVRLLENPEEANATTAAQNEEQQSEDEMTPVIEARVLVPPGGQVIDDNDILNAVQNSIFPSVSSMDAADITSTGSSTSQSGNLTSEGLANETTADGSANATASEGPSNPTTSEGSTGRSRMPASTSGTSNGDSARNTARQSRRCGLPEMATLLSTLNQLQSRFAPFLARYQEFMLSDPQVEASNLTETRHMLNRVPQIMHLLGHAYHSLSDIIVNVDQPRPRLLLCHPILIQGPPSGIPIQVEAQINLSTERPRPSSANGGAGSNADSAGGRQQQPQTPRSTTDATAEAAAPAAQPQPSPRPQPQAQPQVNAGNLAGISSDLGVSFSPGGSMRVINLPANPLGIQGLRLPQNVGTPSQRGQQPDQNATAPNTNTGNGGAAPTAQAQPAGGNPFEVPLGGGGAGGGNMEFFMEVTPESLRGGGGNFFQSLIQLVGSQIGDTLNQAQAQVLAQNQTMGNATGQENGRSQQQEQQPQQQPSQARSTQTNPTTATRTRSTARPQVHMTQQTVQGGFDPFLHCYSHHVPATRHDRVVRESSGTTRSTAPNPAQSDAASSASQQRPFTRPVDRLLHSYQNLFQNFSDMVSSRMPGSMRHYPPTPRNSNPSQQPRTATEMQSTSPIVQLVQMLLNIQTPIRGIDTAPAHAHIRTIFRPVIASGQGASVLEGLIRMVLRTLRLMDLSELSTGNMSAFISNTNVFREHFVTSVCANDTSAEGIARASGALIDDIRRYITNLLVVPTRCNIDMARSIDAFLQARLPELIRLAVDQGHNIMHMLTPLWLNIKQFFSLVIYCSRDGRTGVEKVIDQFLLSSLRIPSSVPLHDELMRCLRANVRTFFDTVVSESHNVQEFVVVKAQTQEPSASTAEEARQGNQQGQEAMDVDTSPVNAELLIASAPIRVEDTELLPNVVFGSENWHRETNEEWVPIITRDIQRQRRQNSQPPFSDAYLSGMPSKRRKLIKKAKSPEPLRQVIAENLQQSVSATGLASVAPLETVTRTVSEVPEVQTAYRNLLQTTVAANLRNNEDFSADRYPNAANYFNESSSE